jgi:hypothetical protein
MYRLLNSSGLEVHAVARFCGTSEGLSVSLKVGVFLLTERPSVSPVSFTRVRVFQLTTVFALTFTQSFTQHSQLVLNVRKDTQACQPGHSDSTHNRMAMFQPYFLSTSAKTRKS